MRIYLRKEKKRGIAGENPKRIRISNTEQKFMTPKPQSTKAILMEKQVKVFLDSVLAENTRKTYTSAR